MKGLIAVLIVVVAVSLYAGDAKKITDDKAALNKRIDILESKVFALENENRKLKAEVEKKDKIIEANKTGKAPVAEKTVVRRNPQFEKQAKEKIEKEKEIAANNIKIAELEKKRIVAQKHYDYARREYKTAVLMKNTSERKRARQKMGTYKDEMWKIDSAISLLKFHNSRSYVVKK